MDFRTAFYNRLLFASVVFVLVCNCLGVEDGPGDVASPTIQPGPANNGDSSDVASPTIQPGPANNGDSSDVTSPTDQPGPATNEAATTNEPSTATSVTDDSTVTGQYSTEGDETTQPPVMTTEAALQYSDTTHVVLDATTGDITESTGQTTPQQTDQTSIPLEANTSAAAEPLRECPLEFAEDVVALTTSFRKLLDRGARVVFFRLKYENGEAFNKQVGDNAYTPSSVWAWAKGSGRIILRLPLDYRILSLGFLAIRTYEMDLYLKGPDVEGCQTPLNNSEIIHHLVATLLKDHVTAKVTNQNMDAVVDGLDLVCRMAYTSENGALNYQGVGYRCCHPRQNASGYTCDDPYDDGWTLLWYGPVALLGLLYAVMVLQACRFVNTNRRSQRKNTRLRQLALQTMKEELVKTALRRRTSNTEAPFHVASNLVTLRERVTLLDTLGFTADRQATIVKICTMCFYAALVLLYYAIFLGVIIGYSHLSVAIKLLSRGKDVFFNVFGHPGWLFARTDLGIFAYAILETTLALLAPFLLAMVYASTVFTTDAQKVPVDEEARHAVPFEAETSEYGGGGTSDSSGSDAGGDNAQAQVPGSFVLVARRFFNSLVGKILTWLCFLLLVIYFILAIIFVAYVLFFAALGMAVNVEVVAPWAIPIVAAACFISRAFHPLTRHYKVVKVKFFDVAPKVGPRLLLRRGRDSFLPSDLLDNFFAVYARDLLMRCVLEILSVVIMVVLLLLVLLAVQHPYLNQTSLLGVFLGLQISLVFVYLAWFNSSGNLNTMDTLDNETLEADIEDAIVAYERDMYGPELDMPDKYKLVLDELRRRTAQSELTGDDETSTADAPSSDSRPASEASSGIVADNSERAV